MGKNLNYLKCISSLNIFAYILPVSAKQNRHKKLDSCVFLPLSFSPFLFLVLPFLKLTDSDFFPIKFP